MAVNDQARTRTRWWFSAAAVLLLVAVGAGDSVVAPPGRDRRSTTPEVSIDTALAAAAGATDYYLRIRSVPGDSTVPGHVNDIELEGFTWSITNSTGSATGGRFTNLTVTKYVDPASPLLMQATAGGTLLGTAVLFAEKPGTQPFEYVRFTLSGTEARSFKEVGDGAGIVETVGLGFTKVTMRYRKQNFDGSAGATIERCWNLTTHATC